MKWIGSFLYLIAFVLLLHVVKRIVVGLHPVGSFYIGTIIICVQFFCVAAFLLLGCFYWLYGRLRLQKRWLWSGSTVLLLFVITELVFGSLLNHPQRIPSWLRWSFQFYYDGYDCRLIQYEANASVYNEALFYTLKPDARFDYRNREFATAFETNSKGVRDDEGSLQAPEVICLGDSYAMGWGVQQQETYAQCLEKLSGMKVLNAGVSSYGTARELIQLKQFDTSRLKYVVIQYCANDLEENLSFTAHGERLPISPKSLFDSLVKDQEQVRSYFPLKHALLIGQLFLKQQVNRVRPVFSMPLGREQSIGDAREHAAAFLKVLKAAPIDFRRVKVIVLMLDGYLRKDNGFLNEVKAQLPGYGGNVRVVDVAAALDKDDYFELDLHINARGHRKVADSLWRVMGEGF